MKKISISLAAALAAVVFISDIQDSFKPSKEILMFFPFCIADERSERDENNEDDGGITVIDGGEIQIKWAFAELFKKLFIVNDIKIFT